MSVRPALARFAELLALASVGIGQPLLDLLGREPAFFVAHRSQRLDLVLLALLPTFGIAGLLLAVEGLAGLLRRAWLTRTHQALLVLLAVPIGFLVAKRLPALPPVGTLGVAIAIVLAIALLARTRGGATFLATAGGLAAVLLPLHFLLFSPASSLMRPAAAGGRGETTAPLAVRRPMPVVVLVFDELPLSSILDEEGHIAAHRFPAFAALAARSTWYPQATAVSAQTQLAVPSLLTGRYAAPGDLPIHAAHPRNLFTMLAGSHRVNAFESLTRLCPPSVCDDDAMQEPTLARLRSLFADVRVVYLHLVAPPALANRLPPISGTWSGFDRGPNIATASTAGGAAADPDGRRRDVPRQLAAFLARLDASAGDARPGLHYLHLELPHIPWRYLPSGREYGPISTSFFAHGVASDTTWRADDWLIAQGLQRHLLQLAYADRVLAEVWAGLTARGLDRTALLVVTADHGLAFAAEEPGRVVTTTNYGEVLSVPLFIRQPGQTAADVSSLPAQIVDLLPTIADALDVDLGWPVDGSSLLETASFPPRTELHLVDSPTAGPLPLADLGAQQRRAVARITRWFGDDRPPADLFSLSTRPELLGRAVSEVMAPAKTASAPRIGVALEQPWFFDRVDPEGPFLPVQIVGRLLPPSGGVLAGQEQLAVAVNGVVRATTRSFRDGAATRFSAIVREESFVAGRNLVQVLLVDEGGRLVATDDRSGPRYRLRRSGSGEVTGVEATNGTSCTVDPRAVAGGLVREDWYVAGWADPASESWPMAVVMVFVGDELTHVVTTSGAPPAASVAAGHPAREGTGFRFTIPESLRGGGDLTDLLVLGVAGERCSPLAFERVEEAPAIAPDSP